MIMLADKASPRKRQEAKAMTSRDSSILKKSHKGVQSLCKQVKDWILILHNSKSVEP